MKATVRVSNSIDVSHESPVWFTCPDRLHGHTYDIGVTVDFDPSTSELWEHSPSTVLIAHLAELDERSLNEMIRPARPNHYGLAAWVMDRMQRDFSVVMVSVSTTEVEIELWADEVRRR